MAQDGGGIAATGADRRRSIITGRSGHVRAAILSAPFAALLLVALVAVGALDFLRRDGRAVQETVTVHEGLAADADGRGSAFGELEPEAAGDGWPGRELGAAAGAFLLAAVALVVLAFAAAGFAVLLVAGTLWAVMRKRRPVTRG